MTLAVRTIAIALIAFAGLSGVRPAAAQMSAADMVVRLDQLENQMRQLTGAIEQLQFRNQQLETQLKRMQEDAEFRFQELGSRAGSGTARPGLVAPAPHAAQPAPPPQTSPPSGLPPPSASRRSDAFDPDQNAGAPGAPRQLGAIPMGAPAARPLAGGPMGAPDGRQAGAPLDLSTLSAAAASDPGLAPRRPAEGGPLPPPPPRNPNATGGQLATLPPSQSPRDEYDLAYGYLLRKDYALADETFRSFLHKFPNDRLAPEAQYWLGETLFQRHNYRDAADAFLALSKKHEASTKAPDALLRLGQSLAALNERELACATFLEIGRKYPRASPTVKQTVEREQKRARC